MEILGFEETPECKFHDETFNKSQYPGFTDLLADNKFLGTGDFYLHSDQIVKVRFSAINGDVTIEQHIQALRVFLRGPSSIQVLKNPSRSRINRFGISYVTPALVAFVATVVSQLELSLFCT